MAYKHNKARALTILAHKLGRAVYFMLKRKTVFDLLYPVCRICALPELSSNWMISHLLKSLSLMNEPVEGEPELILERQARWTCQ